MTTQTANALYRYFKALYDLNQTVMMLGSIEETEEMDTADELIEKVILLVPRIIPYGKGKNKQTYTILSKRRLVRISGRLTISERKLSTDFTESSPAFERYKKHTE